MNKCCMCEYSIRQGSEFFHFRKCYNEHGRWAHRVCKNCWFKIVVPLSQETHLKCYGCRKELPLWKFEKQQYKKKIDPKDVIDLT